MNGLGHGLVTGNRGFPSIGRNQNGVVLPVGYLGSVLGPLLFIIYINDIGSGVTKNISKLADDTKIGRTIRTGEDARALQEDLNKLSAWSDRWQINFNINKCSVLSIGTRNPVHGYSLDSTVMGRTDSERDLGVLVNSDLKLRKQCISARNKANRVF